MYRQRMSLEREATTMTEGTVGMTSRMSAAIELTKNLNAGALEEFRCDLGNLPHTVIHADGVMCADSLDVVFAGHGMAVEGEDGEVVFTGIPSFKTGIIVNKHHPIGVRWDVHPLLHHTAESCKESNDAGTY